MRLLDPVVHSLCKCRSSAGSSLHMPQGTGAPCPSDTTLKISITHAFCEANHLEEDGAPASNERF